MFISYRDDAEHATKSMHWPRKPKGVYFVWYLSQRDEGGYSLVKGLLVSQVVSEAFIKEWMCLWQMSHGMEFVC
jgi:hypothetical protein